MDKGDWTNIQEMETHIIELHEQSAKDAADIWRDGLNVYLRALDPLAGLKVEQEEDPVLLALLVRGWNSVYCAYQLALRGHYSQALNLLRTPIEDWMAYWYLRNFPEERDKFTNTSLRTPTYNTMLRNIESKNKRGPGQIERDWIKRLHKFSHVDSAGVMLVTLPDETSVHLVLGPQFIERVFRYCSSEAVSAIVALLEAVENLRLLKKCDPILQRQPFVNRATKWLSALIKPDTDIEDA